MTISHGLIYLNLTGAALLVWFIWRRAVHRHETHEREFCPNGELHKWKDNCFASWQGSKCKKCNYSEGFYMAGGPMEAGQDMSDFFGGMFLLYLVVLPAVLAWFYGFVFFLGVS